jgi:hypothetical protein
MLIIYDISHVNNFMLIMALQTSQINIVVKELVHFCINTILNRLYLFLLLIQQFAKIGFTFLFIIVHDFSELAKVFFHFALNNLSVALLYSVEVALGLTKLVLSILYQVFGAVDLLLYFTDCVRNYFYLRSIQVQFVNALSA